MAPSLRGGPGIWDHRRMPTGVTVVRDGRVRAGGYRDGQAVVYDWGFTAHGVDYVQRSFVLLDTGFQINQPATFPEQQRGWWYCDLVRVVDEGHTVHVDDNWIDVIVGPPEHPYRVLDLDEYADAIAAGELDAADGVDGLRRTQLFLDRHLNRRHDTRRDRWPDFPPRAIAALAGLPVVPGWEHLDT
ncbi:hypothetical protein GCM10010168_23960 [Actinoplanes ianthinogenes]|nr:hypothetical protein GCM10010168_23960 [Actinoplanes ianthinogenes]